MNDFIKKNKILILILVYALAAIALRCFYLYQFSFSPLFETPRGPDVEEYCNWAKEIVAGRFLWPYVKIHAPLYPFFLALLYWFFADGQHCFYFIRLTQILLGFATCIPLCGIIMLIFKEQNDEKNNHYSKMLITFLIIWGWYPPLIYYLGELTSEILLIPLLSSAVFLIYKAESDLPKPVEEKKNLAENSEKKGKSKERPIHPQTKNIYLAVAGICCGLAIIVHPLALFFTFSEFIYLFLKRNFKGLAAFGILSVMTVFPISFYNIVILREAIPIQANGGFNLYLGNNEEADGTCSLRPGPEWDAFHLGADYKSRELGISKDSLLIQKTVKFIFNNPRHWLKLLFQKAVLAWNQREITAGADLFPLRYFTSFQSMFSWAFGACAVLALVAIFVNWTNWGFYARYRHILILIGAFWIAQALLVTSGRYRISMVPCMLILTAWTITHAIAFIRKRKGNHIRFLLSLLAAIAIVYIPHPPFKAGREQGEADTMLGEAYLLERNFDQAEKHLQSAVKKLPPWSRSYNLLGLVKEKQNKYQEARDLYLKAVKTDPSNPDGFMNIALLFSRNGDAPKATDFFDKAFSLKKPSAELFYNYGLFCFNNGDKEAARKNYLTCLKINPAHEMALNNLGIIAFMKGEYKEASAYFEKALSLDPRNARRMVNLAAAKFATGDKFRAEIIIDKALQIDPELSTAKELKLKLSQ